MGVTRVSSHLYIFSLIFLHPDLRFYQKLLEFCRVQYLSLNSSFHNTFLTKSPTLLYLDSAKLYRQPESSSYPNIPSAFVMKTSRHHKSIHRHCSPLIISNINLDVLLVTGGVLPPSFPFIFLHKTVPLILMRLLAE